MENPNPYKIRNILIPSILVGIIAISIISSIILYSIQLQQSAQLRDNLEKRLEDDVSATAFHVSQIAGLQISGIMQTTQLLSGAPVILRNEGEGITQLLQSSVASSEIVDLFFIFDKRSVMIHTTSTVQKVKDQIGKEFPDHPSFVTPRDTRETFVSNLIIGFDGSSYRIHVASPIIDPETHEFLGVVGASIPGETFANSIKNAIQIGSRDSLSLIDASGNIVYVSNSNNTMIGVNLLSEKIINQIPESIRSGFVQSMTDAVQGKTGVYVVDFRENPELNTNQTDVDIAMIAYTPVIVKDKVLMIALLVKSENIQSLVQQGENSNFVLFAFIYYILIIMAAFAVAIIIINRRLTKKVVESTKALLDSNVVYKMLVGKLEEQKKELQAADTAKEEFAAMISHELKTPLTPIQGYLDLLLRGRIGDLTEQQKQVIKIMSDNSERLLRLIQDILDVRKMEVGRLKLSVSETSSKYLVQQCINAFQTIVKDKSITLVDVAQEINLKCDAGRIVQVLNNIISNSVKFVTTGGRIEINAFPDDGKVTFSIKDNGMGIPKEKQKDLFQKFYQVDTSLGRKSGGSGLGLAICKGIIEAHGGRIWIDSEEDKGTTVYFSIPREYQK